MDGAYVEVGTASGEEALRIGVPFDVSIAPRVSLTDRVLRI